MSLVFTNPTGRLVLRQAVTRVVNHSAKTAGIAGRRVAAMLDGQDDENEQGEGVRNQVADSASYRSDDAESAADAG